MVYHDSRNIVEYCLHIMSACQMMDLLLVCNIIVMLNASRSTWQ